MRKYVTCRKEIDRTSNISSVRDHDPNFYVNDISRAAKLGKDLPKVSVSYGNDMLFNSPSVAIEDIPVEGSDVESPLTDYAEACLSQLEAGSSAE